MATKIEIINATNEVINRINEIIATENFDSEKYYHRDNFINTHTKAELEQDLNIMHKILEKYLLKAKVKHYFETPEGTEYQNHINKLITLSKEMYKEAWENYSQDIIDEFNKLELPKNWLIKVSGANFIRFGIDDGTGNVKFGNEFEVNFTNDYSKLNKITIKDIEKYLVNKEPVNFFEEKITAEVGFNYGTMGTIKIFDPEDKSRIENIQFMNAIISNVEFLKKLVKIQETLKTIDVIDTIISNKLNKILENPFNFE